MLISDILLEMPASNFKSGRFDSFYREVRRDAGMMFGLDKDEDNELTPERVRQWIASHRKLFRAPKVTVYRAMKLTDEKVAGLRAGSELGQHWSSELRPENFDDFDIGNATSVVVFTAMISAADVHFPLSVAYNCLFPNENELFLKTTATPVVQSIRRYSFNTDQFGEEERPDLIGKQMQT